jgi:hypothetical protein
MTRHFRAGGGANCWSYPFWEPSPESMARVAERRAEARRQGGSLDPTRRANERGGAFRQGAACVQDRFDHETATNETGRRRQPSRNSPARRFENVARRIPAVLRGEASAFSGRAWAGCRDCCQAAPGRQGWTCPAGRLTIDPRTQWHGECGESEKGGCRGNPASPV